MKKFTKILSLALAVVLIVGAFAACGKKEEGDKTTNTAKTAKVINIKLTEEKYAFGVDKAKPELLTQVNEILSEMKANGEFDEIINHYFGNGTPVPVVSAKEDASKDQLIIATAADFPPFEYTEGTNFVGIDMEIAAALAKKMNKELVINNMNFESVCMSVQQHKCDIAMAGLTITPERAELLNFANPYYEASQNLIVPSSETKFDACKTADDVLAILQTLDSSSSIGFQSGTTGQKYAECTNEYEENALKVKTQGYDNAAQAVQDMLNGNLTYVITDEVPANQIVKQING